MIKKDGYLTNIIIGINIVMFLISAYLSQSIFDINTGVLIFMGAKFNPLIRAGQYYRLLTCAFLHGGIVHIGLNMYALYMIGPLVEKVYGEWQFLIIYLISAIFSSTCSYLLSSSVSIGASGAIFGLLGATLVLAIKMKNILGSDFKKNIVAVILINFIIGVSMPNIDNFGHFGGLLGGILISLIIFKKRGY